MRRDAPRNTHPAPTRVLSCSWVGPSAFESNPYLEDQLPDLFEFVRTLARQIEAGELRDGDELVLRLRDFYTVDRMQTVEIVAPRLAGHGRLLVKG